MTCIQLLIPLSPFFFFQVSAWIVREILTKVQIKHRIDTLRYFIKMLEVFIRINNFHGVTSIISAFNSSPIKRLKNSWSAVEDSSSMILETGQRLTSHSRSYKDYRDALEAADPPKLPFIGVCMTDITFIEDGNPLFVETNGQLNFVKQKRFFDALNTILACQKIPYKIVDNYDLQSYLANLPRFDNDEQAYLESMRIEPRNPEEAIEKMLVEEGNLRLKINEMQTQISCFEV